MSDFHNFASPWCTGEQESGFISLTLPLSPLTKFVFNQMFYRPYQIGANILMKCKLLSFVMIIAARYNEDKPNNLELVFCIPWPVENKFVSGQKRLGDLVKIKVLFSYFEYS